MASAAEVLAVPGGPKMGLEDAIGTLYILYSPDVSRQRSLASSLGVRYLDIKRVSKEDIMIVSVAHSVADFDSWKPVFDEHGASRKAHGAVSHRVLRRSDEPNSVIVLTEFSDRSQAEAFLADPSLRAAMGRAGVEGVPEITFWEVADESDYSSIGV